MDKEQFINLAKNFNVVPVYEVITADLLTPVLAYLKLRKQGTQSFLLESVEGSMNLARYSYIGIQPQKIITNKGFYLKIKNGRDLVTRQESIFEFLDSEIIDLRQPSLETLPPFTGGLVGFIGYENIALIEKTLKFDNLQFNSYDTNLALYKTILAFDHYKHQLILITNSFINENSNLDYEYEQAKGILKKIKKALSKDPITSQYFKLISTINDFNHSEFYKDVLQSKNDIKEGEIFQIVLSRRFSAQFKGDLLNVYRSLRIINPSPYMYFLEQEDGCTILGTSPEDLLIVKQGKAQLLPIAGTRKRGSSSEEDLKMENDLLNDPKEVAEHTMLVDLGRNDLNRICKYGSVKVSEFMKIQRYSHVMHIVSRVEGVLDNNKNSIDALKSCFPAGTVTGAPKIRAMELISDYEKEERNVYAGAIGYLDFSGNLDMCIAIRTLFSKGDTIYWQAGAGIVADSKPELEAKEILNKSAVMVSALKFAEGINENSGN